MSFPEVKMEFQILIAVKNISRIHQIKLLTIVMWRSERLVTEGFCTQVKVPSSTSWNYNRKDLRRSPFLHASVQVIAWPIYQHYNVLHSRFHPLILSLAKACQKGLQEKPEEGMVATAAGFTLVIRRELLAYFQCKLPRESDMTWFPHPRTPSSCIVMSLWLDHLFIWHDAEKSFPPLNCI